MGPSKMKYTILGLTALLSVPSSGMNSPEGEKICRAPGCNSVLDPMGDSHWEQGCCNKDCFDKAPKPVLLEWMGRGGFNLYNEPGYTSPKRNPASPCVSNDSERPDMEVELERQESMSPRAMKLKSLKQQLEEAFQDEKFHLINGLQEEIDGLEGTKLSKDSSLSDEEEAPTRGGDNKRRRVMERLIRYETHYSGGAEGHPPKDPSYSV